MSICSVQSTGWSKIGESKHPERRLAELQREYPELKCYLVTSIRTDDCRGLEEAFHQLFWKERKRVVGDAKEWFKLEAPELKFFESLASALRVSSADRPPGYDVADDEWTQIVREIEKTHFDIAFACSEAVFGSTDGPRAKAEGILLIVFPKSRDFLLKLLKTARGEEALLDAAERVTGDRPRSIRYEINEWL